MCAARPGAMTFTRLSTVMNTLLWDGMEEAGEWGRRVGRVSAAELSVDEGSWRRYQTETNIYCLASANKQRAVFINSHFPTISELALSDHWFGFTPQLMHTIESHNTQPPCLSSGRQLFYRLWETIHYLVSRQIKSYQLAGKKGWHQTEPDIFLKGCWRARQSWKQWLLDLHSSGGQTTWLQLNQNVDLCPLLNMSLLTVTNWYVKDRNFMFIFNIAMAIKK